MSSIPGYELEDYVMWEHDLIVGDHDSANESLRIVEILGRPTRRVRITREQFAPLLNLYEPHREAVERSLLDFDEDSQSWRDYAGYAFTVPSRVIDAANDLRNTLTPNGTN